MKPTGTCTEQGCQGIVLWHGANDSGRCYYHFTAIDCDAM